ncbi:MAG: hypothetical protein AAB092_06655 [Chloroflexota bacterium]
MRTAFLPADFAKYMAESAWYTASSVEAAVEGYTDVGVRPKT